jgi:hypothetical protein
MQTIASSPQNFHKNLFLIFFPYYFYLQHANGIAVSQGVLYEAPPAVAAPKFHIEALLVELPIVLPKQSLLDAMFPVFIQANPEVDKEPTLFETV